MNCRHCRAPLSLPLIDLGSAPPSNAYLGAADLDRPEKWFPLRVLVCTRCWLVQTQDFATREDLFTPEYAYFSGYSSGWLSHVEEYVTDMVQRWELARGSHVVEIGANDGSLLQYVQARGIPCTGIEPTEATSRAARAKGLEIIGAFFGRDLGAQLAVEGRSADLIAANNVLAHVPDINDFVQGFAQLLKPRGVATFEFPHMLHMIDHTQFDTIYHEHFSYLSLGTVRQIFEANGLRIFDVEELATHGGSLRVFAHRSDADPRPVEARVAALLQREEGAGLFCSETYTRFQTAAERVRNDFLIFLLEAAKDGRKVAAYGAAAKGATLLNFAGVRPDLLPFVADRNPAKQGRHMPGCRIPIVAESWIREERPAHVVILPWNLREEIMHQLEYVRSWGGTFVTAIPFLEFTE